MMEYWNNVDEDWLVFASLSVTKSILKVQLHCTREGREFWYTVHHGETTSQTQINEVVLRFTSETSPQTGIVVDSIGKSFSELIILR